eukprot:372649_1
MAAHQVIDSDNYKEPENKEPEVKQNEAVKQNMDQVIRIGVLGATGAGKSTICNLLCGNINQFEVNDFGMDSKTQEISSATFSYSMNNEQLLFEVIDTPGFFDTQHETAIDKTIHTMKTFAKDIRRCRELTVNGIDVFLLVIPMGPLTDVHKNTIKFMKTYFDKEACKHVILVISKSKGYNIEILLQNIKNKQKQQKAASDVLMQFLEIIDERCIATECEKDDHISKQSRQTILNAVRARVLANKASYYGDMWKEFETKYKELRRKRRIYYKMANVGIFSILTVASIAFKYRDEKMEVESTQARDWAEITKQPFLTSAYFFLTGLIGYCQRNAQYYTRHQRNNP